MAFMAEVVADSINRWNNRLITFEATYPRIVHSEMMTHRVFSRNSASTRAIPLSTQLRNLLENPFIPEKFGINMKGMQAAKNLVGLKHDQAVRIWLNGRDRALTTVLELILGTEITGDILKYDPLIGFVSGERLQEHFDELMKLIPKSTDEIDLESTSMLNVHKQIAGRGLEAYMWHTIVLTATEFENYYALRDHPDAQGEIATIARLMHEAATAHEPTFLETHMWHLPYVKEGEFSSTFDGIRASAARCAASSYNRQRAERAPEDEFARYDDLRGGGHMSPLEHQATPHSEDEHELREELAAAVDEAISFARVQQQDIEPSLKLSPPLYFSGNLRGYTQHRKQIEHEDNFGELRAA